MNGVSAAHGMIYSGKLPLHFGHDANLGAVGQTMRVVSCWSISNDIYQRVSEASCCRRVNISCVATCCHYHRRLYPGCYVAPWCKRVMSGGIWVSFVFREEEIKRNRFKDRRTLCVSTSWQIFVSLWRLFGLRVSKILCRRWFRNGSRLETKTYVLVVAPCSQLMYCATHKYIVTLPFLTEVKEI